MPPGHPSALGLSLRWCTPCILPGCTLHSPPTQKMEYIGRTNAIELVLVSVPTTKHLCRRKRLNVWKVHLLANLLTPGLALALGPVPAHLLLEKNPVSNVASTAVFSQNQKGRTGTWKYLAIVPYSWLIALNVQTLFGRVFNVTKRVVWV